VERKSRNRWRDPKGTRQRMQKKDDAPYNYLKEIKKKGRQKEVNFSQEKQSSEELKNWRRVSLVERET
jgi:hypothetical protein